jgi:hypothetical protein
VTSLTEKLLAAEGRQPTRTDLVEARLERISTLRREVLTARTLARAFEDYSVDLVDVIPTKGDVADRAAVHLAEYAGKQATVFAAVAARKSAKADELEGESLP